MTNPSEVVADLRIAAEDARRFSAALFDRGYVRREGVRPLSELLERAADTIDRLTSTGEPFGYWCECKGAEPVFLRKPAYIPPTDRLHTTTPLYASPREGHVEVPVESEMRTLAEHCAGLMNKLSNRGHTGLMQECPLCQAYIGAARLLAHETDTPMPDEVVIWDRRLEAAALPHNQGETKP